MERLQNAEASELPRLHADYDTYLTTLDAEERKQVISQVEPILRELMRQSSNRLEEAVADYLSRSPKQVLA